MFKDNLKSVIIVGLIVIFAISSTYAFLNFTSSNNTATGNGGCFVVNYSGQAINNSSFMSTNDYRSGAKSVVTLSKTSNCKIYTEARIYLHTNASLTTAPIDTVSALRYKVTTAGNLGVATTTKERNGMITQKGDVLLATVPLTDTATDYNIYLWLDEALSHGAFHDTSYSGYIYATSVQTSTIGAQDTFSPSLFLTKETYQEGFDGFNLTNSTIGSDGVLTLAPTGTSGSARSGYYHVDGEEWTFTFDAYTTSASTHLTPKGSVGVGGIYYDANKVDYVSLTGYSSNGWAPGLTLNTWGNSLNWKNSSWSAATKDANVKNIRVEFSTGNEYSQPITKVRNFRVYGQLPSSFYTVYVDAKDNVGVVTTKYASGRRDKAYFLTNGTNVTNNQFQVTANGEYTIYVADAAGNAEISTISITNII